MCALAAPPIRLQIRIRTLNPKECCNIRSQYYSFHGTFVPGTVRSLDHSFTRRIDTADLSLLGPFVPWTIHSLELSELNVLLLHEKTRISDVRSTSKHFPTNKVDFLTNNVVLRTICTMTVSRNATNDVRTVSA